MSREGRGFNYDLNYFSIFFINKKMDGDLILGPRLGDKSPLDTISGDAPRCTRSQCRRQVAQQRRPRLVRGALQS